MSMIRPLSMMSMTAAMIVLVVSVAGCQKTGGGSMLDQARQDYETGRYTVAYRRAERAVSSASGLDEDRAAYIAGISAARLNKTAEAERYLRQAKRSGDPDIAGRACAQLGLLRLDGGRPQSAARLFTRAQSLLDGEQARQAARHAARAYDEAGDMDQARKWRAIGWPNRYGNKGGAFSVQIGAFHEKERARQAAAEVRSEALGEGLAPVRVVPRHDDRGRMLYLVQLGRFTSHSAADMARSRLTGRTSIVAAYVTGHD